MQLHAMKNIFIYLVLPVVIQSSFAQKTVKSFSEKMKADVREKVKEAAMAYYVLGPENLESCVYLYRLTKDVCA